MYIHVLTYIFNMSTLQMTGIMKESYIKTFYRFFSYMERNET